MLLSKAFETGDIGLIKKVTEDKIHEPFRKQFIREWNDVENAINDCDACEPGQCYTCMHGFDGWKKTGRSFPQIAEVLKRLQEGEE